MDRVLAGPDTSLLSTIHLSDDIVVTIRTIDLINFYPRRALFLVVRGAMRPWLKAGPWFNPASWGVD